MPSMCQVKGLAWGLHSLPLSITPLVSAQANVINTMRAQPAGSQLEISCSVSGGFSTDRPIFFMWVGPNGAVPSNGRISANNASNGLVFAATYVYTSTLTFSTLSSQDNNTMYQCSVGTLYTPYFTQYSSSPTSNATILVNGVFSVLCVHDILTHLCFPLSLST